MTRDEARRIAANIACRRCWSGRSFERLNCEPTDHCGGCPHIGRGHTEFLRSYCFGRFAVALTNQAEKAQAFDALSKLVRPIILLYPCLGLFPAMYFAASETDHRKLNP
jgi:hypothetical protein